MLLKLKNLLSRKFLIALITVIGGLMSAFNCSGDTVALVTSIGVALIPSVIYIITEGKIDAAAVKTAATAVSETLTQTEAGVDE